MRDKQSSDQELDTTGYHCPLPALKARRQLASMQAGEVLHLIATDPRAQIDIPHFCQEQGHALIEQWQQEQSLHFRIRRRP